MSKERDPALEEALAALQRFPQAEVAERVGMSVRRLRDVERGRSRPRRATRTALIALAEATRNGGRSNAKAIDDEGGNPLGLLAVVGVVLVVLLGWAALISGRHNNFDLTLPDLGAS